MNLIESAVRWRHGTFVAFCLLALAGLFALVNLPLELQPGGDRPEITITTVYPGAGPAEVEDLITRPIEEQMERVIGLREVSSSSRSGRSTITLEFMPDSDLNERLLDVINRLQQVPSLPPEAQESSVEQVGGNSSPMMWIPFDTKEGFTPDPNRYRDLAEEEIAPRLRQVQGIGQLLIVGGQLREVEVRVDPRALADRNLSIGDVVRVLRENNRDIRGGPLVVGRREYRVRTVSRSQEISQLEGFVLRRDAGGTVYLRDVARVQMGRQPQDSALMFNGKPAVAIGIIRQVGANVPEISKGVRGIIAEMQAQFDRQNQGIRFVYNYDENEYVSQSALLVQENLIGGAVLAVIVLLLFLGSLRTVAVVALTIPTTMVTVFIAMALFDRTLNIISLAALGFASGMVVDNAIVVVENAFTHMQQGKSPMRAAIDGTQEVAGGLLGATLTNVAVFLPLALVKGEIAQLFIDMTITITAAAIFSMIAAITLVPMLSGLFLDRAEAVRVLEGGQFAGGNWFVRKVAQTSAAFRVGQGRFERSVLKTVGWSLGRQRVGRRLLVLAVPLGLLVVSILWLPPADYLPEGNRNLVFWRAEPLPGTSIPESIAQSEPLRKFLREQPEIDRVMFVDRPGGFRGVAAILKPQFASTKGLSDTIERMREQSDNFAGYRFLVPTRISIFRDPGKEFEVDIVGPDLNRLNQLDRDISGKLRSLDGVKSTRSNFVMGAGELQVIPQRERLAEVGIAESDLGSLVEAALGGRFASHFVDGKEELDVVVQLEDAAVQTPEQLRQLPLFTRGGQQVQLGDVAEVRETTGPDAINHVDLERSVTLTASLAPEAPLGTLVDRTQKEILAPLRASLPPGYRVSLAGSADRLAETVSQLVAAFAVSVAIVYLLLVALYKSFLYPVVIMATVPIGMSGALLSLVIANWIPGMLVPFDMITALGFIILTGVVVNNAILIVERALQLQDEGADYDASLYDATRDRLRAIFMSAGTSILGMLPLAVVPGQGAELYQGLGIVLTGGLAFSTVLTPTVVPALMGLLRDFSGRKISVPSQRAAAPTPVAPPSKIEV
ncbi:efflux RND transporter permease subunit [Altericista sp. CCNU0014]|uniref:efflux RND transporter permease subunit n=1 Tax=Altericista sp. CCNU0014 TaxID=3082949 RepID=UPI003850F55A